MMTFLAGKVAKSFVEYFNSETVLHSIYPSPQDTLVLQGTEKDWLINLQKVNGYRINDTLEQLIHPKNGKNNFWFCYADVNLSNKLEVEIGNTEITIEDAESSTFWALKGVTISQIKGKNSISITAEDSCKQIFKYTNGEIQSKIFPKKLFADPYIFPGY